MPVVTISALAGINVKTNPLNINSSEMLRCVNMDNYHFGAKKKRPGYTQQFGTATTQAPIDQFFSWQKDDGTTSFVYALSNNRLLYYDVNGTATDWTPCGNGTLGAAYVGNASLENTLIIGDGTTATRHTTNGTAFTNTSLAPYAFDFTDYQDRVYAINHTSQCFYSSLGDATNWNTSGTSDSSSINIPGPGGLNKIFKSDDRVLFNKTSGNQFRWDGYTLFDMTTNYGITSPKSLDQHDSEWYGLNRYGLFQYNGNGPTMLSNGADSLFFNDRGTGITKAGQNNNCGAFFQFDYLLTMGNVADDITLKTINNCLLLYDVRLQELRTYSLNTLPTAMTEIIDSTGTKRLLIGDATGTTYILDPNAFTDAGAAIYAEMEFLFHGGTLQRKKFDYFRALFNPGCEAHIQIALTDTFIKGGQTWVDLGDATSGVVEYRFPPDNRVGRLLFVRIYEASKTGRFEFFGYEVSTDLETTGS